MKCTRQAIFHKGNDVVQILGIFVTKIKNKKAFDKVIRNHYKQEFEFDSRGNDMGMEMKPTILNGFG